MTKISMLIEMQLKTLDSQAKSYVSVFRVSEFRV